MFISVLEYFMKEPISCLIVKFVFQRSKKDKDAPKRPLSGYMIYFNTHREQIKTDNPGIAFTEISKKAGEMWREVKDKTVSSIHEISWTRILICLIIFG